MSNHAFLSPSGSHRWLNCTPSAMLEFEFPGGTSLAAEEGTVAHAFCEHKLKKALHKRSKRPVSDYDSDEMQEHTDSYVEYVLEQLEIAKQTCKDPTVLIEQKVDFSEFVPEGYGTADCIIVSDDTLQIIDFKFGLGVLVNAERNTQLMCYSIGALNIFDSLYDIKEVTMHIFQPRRENIQSWTIPVEELKEWAEKELKPKAEMALKGEGDYHTGEWCQFCRAAVRCRARAEEKLRLAQEEFKMPPLLTDSEIEEVLTVIPDLTKWADGILAYATDAAVNHGKEWKGFKVVEGRSVRKYKDEEMVAQAAKDHGFTDIYRHSLITMTDMQKLMGKKQFETILGNLIVKPKGKPTLVPITDKRPAINVNNAINEFKQED
ncbi:MAG: DUF2800 domain-containing protein [Clostridiales bacterium]|nr:DUF2800 domain-containing protein [Clostridiales bacterium]MBS5877793.1 DUF2800 domain-containing protein [Clostridiales bacterium]